MSGHRVFRRPADAGEHRQQRVNLRLAGAELAAVRQAAAGTRETVSGYAARVLVMAARGELDGGADPVEVRELAMQLIWLRTELAKVAARLDDAAACADDPAGLAELVEECHRTRRQVEQATGAILGHLDRWRRRLARRCR